MLPIYSSFLLKYAVRAPLQFINPKINPIDQVALPRGSIYHYLDLDSSAMFPLNEGIFINGVPDNKKILVTQIQDLSSTLGNPIIKDKQIGIKIRKWGLANIKRFKSFNLLEVAQNESLTIPIVNYNPLKNKYKYTTNVVNNYYKTYNLFYTLFDTVLKVSKTNTIGRQIIEVNIPSSVPSYMIMSSLSKYNSIKQSRIIKDIHLMFLLHIFMWLDVHTKEHSALNTVNEDDSNNILLMFNYKGNVTFVPLNLLVGMLESSSIESTIKYSPDKVQKLFVKFIHGIQARIDKTEIVDDENTDPVADSDSIVTDPSNSTGDLSTDDNNDNDDADEPVEKKPELLTVNNASPIEGMTKVNDKLQASNVNNVDKKGIKDITDLTIVGSDKEALTDFLDSEDEVLTELDKIYVTDINEDNEFQEVENTASVITENTFVTHPEEITKILQEDSIVDKNNKEMHALSAIKLLSSSELNTYKKLMAAREILPSPYDSKIKIDEFKQVTKEAMAIKPVNRVLPVTSKLVTESLSNSSINNFDKDYIQNVLPKHVAACVTHVEKAGLIVKEYTIQNSNTAMGNYDMHRLVIKPLKGNESTLYFRLPKVNSDGVFTAAGVKYKMRKQRSDLPIRKIDYNKVALTSYYSKLFIINTERKAYDTYAYINQYIKDIYFNADNTDSVVQGVVLGSTFNNEVKVPTILSSLSMTFTSIKISGNTFVTDRTNANMDDKAIEALQKEGYYFCGYSSSKNPIVCNFSDEFFIYKTKTDIIALGKMEDILHIPEEKLPISYTELKLLGKNIPMGIVLAYYLGITNLIKILQVPIKVLSSGKRYELEKGEFVVRFNDYKLIFNRNNKEATHLMSGFNYFKAFIKEFNLKDFDDKSVYLNIIEERGFGMWHLKELDMLKDMFLDPITVDVLKEINEPAEYIPLLLRANQLLNTYDHPNINDSDYTREKGYERVAGLTYRVLSESIRNYKFKNTVKNKLELDPYAVWNSITQDNTVKIIEENNPIINLKEIEAVTLAGADGLGKNAISSKMREYSTSDMGLISEATMDSSDVSINTYMTPDPKIENMYGISKRGSRLEHEDDPKKLLSTSALLSVGCDHDD